MSMIDVVDLSFGYEGSYENVFEHVSFRIDTDWKLGFIGRNGRGKTTFLRLLSGSLNGYSGTISKSVDFDYFPFEVTGIDRETMDVITEILGDVPLWEVERELSLLGVDSGVLYRPFGTLSNGEQTKVLLAILFLKQNNFLLIDEPTDHLDMEARRIVGDYLNRKKGYILVSHDRAFLDLCIDHTLSINRTNIEVARGNFSSWFANKEMRENFERAENERLKTDIKRLTGAARRTADWSERIERSKIGEHVGDRGYVGHQAARMMKRSKVILGRRERAIEEKSALLKDVESAESLAIKPISYHKNLLAEFVDVSVSYDGRMVNEPVTFTVCSGDRVQLSGRNGSGKSSLIKLLLGQDITHSGIVRLGSGLIISYVSQDTSFIRGNLRDFAAESGIDETLFLAILRKLDFSRSQFDKDMADFSQGQKKKTLIAKSLCERAHLYIWDEPLNYIDVLSRIQIEDLITEYGPTMVFVEHDQAFAANVGTKTVVLE